MFETWHSPLRIVAVGLPPADGPESVLESILFTGLRSQVLAPWADPSWMGQRFRAGVARVVGLPAGPVLMSALASLGSGPCLAPHPDRGLRLTGQPAFASPGNPCLCLLAVAAAWQACLGYAAANARSAVVGAVGPEPVVLTREGVRPELADPAREELAAVLRLSPGSAGVRIEQSRELAAQTEVGRLVEHGVLPESSAIRICQGLARLDPDDATACGAELAHRVRRRIGRGIRPWTGSDAADCARRLAAKTRSYTKARKRAVADRHVRRWSNGDGTATFCAVLPELTAERMYRRLTAMAHGLGPDGRTLDASRADLLADLVLGTADTRTAGVEVDVIIDAAALLGLAEGAADVPGMGPLDADLARELAGDARWRAWIRDASGAITATGTSTYQPTAAIARLVRARESHCRMPGCRRQAANCDLDHATPWPHGPTTTQNLGPLCRRHHNLKTHYGWNLDTRDHITWTTPAGNTITDHPDPPWLQ